MKKNRILFSLLAVLALVGCQGEVKSSSPSSTNTSDSTSAPASSSSSPKPVISSSKPDEPISSSSSEKPDESTSSVTEEDEEERKWGSEAVALMKKHLNNTVLPYFGTNAALLQYDFEYSESADDYGHVVLDTDLEYNETNLAKISTIYTARGYTLEASDDKDRVTYDLTDKHLRVSFVDLSGTLSVYAYYDEPYNPTAEATYDEDIITEMQSLFAGKTAPYVYFATTDNYVMTPDTRNNRLTLLGGAWDDRLTTNAKKVLTDASYTVQEDGSTITGDITAADGSKFNIVLSKVSASIRRTAKAKLVITYTDVFDPSKGATSWSQEVKDAFNTYLHGKELPFVYLGQTETIITPDAKGGKLLLQGSRYDSKVLDLAKAAFTKEDGWNQETRTITYGEEVYAWKVFDDGSEIEVYVGNHGYNDYSRNSIDATYIAPITAPAEGAWSAKTESLIEEKLKHTLPYVYLHLTDSDGNAIEENPSWDYNTRTLTITGGNWNKNLLSLTKNAFTADGYTVTEDVKEKTYLTTLKATKTFSGEGENGDTLSVTLEESSSQTTPAKLRIKRVEKFDASTQTGWNQDISDTMNRYFNKTTLPFVYLGTDDYHANYSSNTLTISGNTWDDALLTNFKTAYKSQEDDTITWVTTDEKDDSGNAYVKSVGTDANGNTYTVTLSKDSRYGTPLYTATFRSGFNPSQYSDWADETKAEFDTAFVITETDADGNVTGTTRSQAQLPYIYLGVEKPKVSGGAPTSSSQYRTTNLIMSGGSWHDEVISNTLTVLNANNFEAYESYNAYGKTVGGFKEFSDGSILRLQLMKSYSGDIMLSVYYTAPVTYTAVAYPTKIKTTMDNYLTEEAFPEIFYVAPGYCYDYSEKQNYGYDCYCYARISSKTDPFYFTYLVGAEKVLKTNGYATKLVVASDGSTISASSDRLYATKTLSDGKVLHVSFYYSSSLYLKLTKVDPYQDATRSWTSSISDAMYDSFGYILPAFDTGSATPTIATKYSYGKYMRITGRWFDEGVYQSAINAFTADTTLTWSYSYQYIPSSESILSDKWNIDKTLVLTADKGDGNHFTVKISGGYSPDSNTYLTIMDVYYN